MGRNTPEALEKAVKTFKEETIALEEGKPIKRSRVLVNLELEDGFSIAYRFLLKICDKGKEAGIVRNMIHLGIKEQMNNIMKIMGDEL